MGLRDKIAGRLLERQIQKKNRTIRYVNLVSAKKVGIIWKENDQDAFSELKKELLIRDISVNSICWSVQKTTDSELITTAHFSIWRLPKHQTIRSFIDEAFDLLIDITQLKNQCLETVRGLSEAHCKIGSSQNNSSYFDFTINSDKIIPATDLVKHIIDYLTSIKTK